MIIVEPKVFKVEDSLSVEQALRYVDIPNKMSHPKLTKLSH
jgi:hypothetical protein